MQASVSGVCECAVLLVLVNNDPDFVTLNKAVINCVPRCSSRTLKLVKIYNKYNIKFLCIIYQKYRHFFDLTFVELGGGVDDALV